MNAISKEEHQAYIDERLWEFACDAAGTDKHEGSTCARILYEELKEDMAAHAADKTTVHECLFCGSTEDLIRCNHVDRWDSVTETWDWHYSMLCEDCADRQEEYDDYYY